MKVTLNICRAPSLRVSSGPETASPSPVKTTSGTEDRCRTLGKVSEGRSEHLCWPPSSSSSPPLLTFSSSSGDIIWTKQQDLGTDAEPRGHVNLLSHTSSRGNLTLLGCEIGPALRLTWWRRPPRTVLYPSAVANRSLLGKCGRGPGGIPNVC